MKVRSMNVRVETENYEAFLLYCKRKGITQEQAVNYLMELCRKKDLISQGVVKSVFTGNIKNMTSFFVGALTECGFALQPVIHEKSSYYLLRPAGHPEKEYYGVIYFITRKINATQKDSLFHVKGELIEKFQNYAAEHGLEAYLGTCMECEKGRYWSFLELDQIPKAAPKNKEYTVYRSKEDGRLYLRYRNQEDFKNIEEMTRKSLSDGIYRKMQEAFLKTHAQMEGTRRKEIR